MKTYTDTTYAILGILTTNCRTGYEIKQLIDRSLTHFWKISYGQIYPTLKTIVDEELATVTTSSQPSRPERKEYELTSKGKETLKSWLEEPIKQIPAERNEMLLKLFFGRHQSKENTVTVLRDYKKNLEARCLTYKNIEEGIASHEDQTEDAVYWLFTLDYGKRMTQAAIDWCTFTLEQLIKEEE